MPTWPRAPSTRRDRPPLRPPPPPLLPLLPGVATLVLGGEAARRFRGRAGSGGGGLAGAASSRLNIRGACKRTLLLESSAAYGDIKTAAIVMASAW